jgi:hypothetical protein
MPLFRPLTPLPWTAETVPGPVRKGTPRLLVLALLLVSGSAAHAATVTLQTEAGRPRIAASNPANRGTSFPVNATLQIDFDLDMDTSTLNTTNIKLIDLSTGQPFPSWGTGSVSATATRFQSKPIANLDTNTTYALVLTTGVRSDANLSLDPTDPHHRAGTIYGEAWVIEFSTGPTLSTTSIKNTNIGNIIGGPTGGQTGVPVNAIIRINFERAMDPGTVNTTNIVLKKSGVAASVPFNLTYDSVSLTAVITPVSALEYSSTYVLTLTNLLDSLGNALP